MPAGNNNKTAPGKPFKKGESGNPDGRPKVNILFRDRCRAFADEEGLQALIDIAQAEKHRDRMKAIELLLAYGYGKPKQGVELSGEDGNELKIVIERV